MNTVEGKYLRPREVAERLGYAVLSKPECKRQGKRYSNQWQQVSRLASVDLERIAQGLPPVGPPFFKPSTKMSLYPPDGVRAYVEGDAQTLAAIWAKVLRTPRFAMVEGSVSR